MKHPKCPLAGEWTAWMNLEDIMLSEISQAQKDRPCTVSLTEGPRTVKTRDAAWWGLGGRRAVVAVFTWTEFAFGR